MVLQDDSHRCSVVLFCLLKSCEWSMPAIPPRMSSAGAAVSFRHARQAVTLQHALDIDSRGPCMRRRGSETCRSQNTTPHLLAAAASGVAPELCCNQAVALRARTFQTNRHTGIRVWRVCRPHAEDCTCTGQVSWCQAGTWPVVIARRLRHVVLWRLHRSSFISLMKHAAGRRLSCQLDPVICSHSRDRCTYVYQK